MNSCKMDMFGMAIGHTLIWGIMLGSAQYVTQQSMYVMFYFNNIPNI